MRRILAACLAALTALLCCGAAAPSAEADFSAVTPERIARYIITQGCGRDPESLERVDQTRDEQTVQMYLQDIYGLEPESWTGCAIYRAGGAEAFEIAVIRTADEKTAKAAAKALEGYIKDREGDFEGYEPEQAYIVHNAEAAYSEYGDAALLICPDTDLAEDSFQASYTALYRLPFDPPLENDMTLYDTSAILAAWAGGDRSGLSEKDAAILDMAGAVVTEQTDGTMTDLEKERALYAWVTANVIYDQDHYDPLAEMDPDSYDPYGPLANGKGVCLGFATTFQLLMDMAGVECITVVGASSDNTGDHAWNMVRLDGRWYCADPTWDVGSPAEEWDYFNVTSDWMAATNHQWDYAHVPEATAADGGGGA